MGGLKPASRAQDLISARQERSRHTVRPAKNQDVVYLNYGDTAFPTPEHINEAAIKAIRDGHTRYEDVFPLREAIAEKLATDNDIEVDPTGGIAVGPGTHFILFDIMQTYVDPGAEVIVPRPGSPTYFYYNTVLNGGKPVFVPLRPERRFKLDPEEVAEAITPRTKIIGLTTPDTPAGAVQERADLEQIAELAQKHDLLVVSDELYEKINFGQTPHFSIASLPGMFERTITVNGFSKYYSMTGWRVGYAAGPGELIKPVQQMLLTNSIWLNTPAQYAALAAYTGPQTRLKEMLKEYHRRMDILVEGLRAIDGISCLKPEGGYYAWPDISSFGMSSHEFANFALEEGSVSVGPGVTFGPAAGENHLRTSCTRPEEELREGLRRLEIVCSKLGIETVGEVK